MPSYSRGLRLSQPNSQSPVPQNTSVPDPTTAEVNKDDGIKHDDDGAPLRFTLRSTSQVNRVLSVKKLVAKKATSLLLRRVKLGSKVSRVKTEPSRSRRLAQRCHLLTMPKSQQDRPNKHCHQRLSVSNPRQRKLTVVQQPDMRLGNRPSMLGMVKLASKELKMLL